MLVLGQAPSWLRFFVLGVKETAERSIEAFKAILVLKETIEREKLPHILEVTH